jgi:hypothetical protein
LYKIEQKGFYATYSTAVRDGRQIVNPVFKELILFLGRFVGFELGETVFWA